MKHTFIKGTKVAGTTTPATVWTLPDRIKEEVAAAEDKLNKLPPGAEADLFPEPVDDIMDSSCPDVDCSTVCHELEVKLDQTVKLDKDIPIVELDQVEAPRCETWIMTAAIGCIIENVAIILLTIVYCFCCRK